MQIKLTGHGTEITDALRTYVHEKIVKLEEFFKNIQKVEIVLDAREISDAQQRQVAEIRAWMAGNRMIQAREGGKDMYAAFDLALAEAGRQVERHKEKLNHEKRREAKKAKIISRIKTPGLKETPRESEF